MGCELLGGPGVDTNGIVTRATMVATTVGARRSVVVTMTSRYRRPQVDSKTHGL